MGRPITELIKTYEYWQSQPLSDFVKLSTGISTTKVTNLTLKEYCYVRKLHCSSCHDTNCTQCSYMLTAAQIVQEQGIVSLATLFRDAFPGVSYTTSKAKQRLLQMPLAVIRCGQPISGKSQLYVMEYFHGFDYSKIAQLLEKSEAQASHIAAPGITKEELKKLLTIAKSDRERMCVRYAAYKSSGMTPTAARRHGFEGMKECIERVEECLNDAQIIRQTIDELSRTEEKAVLRTLNLKDSDSSSDDTQSTDDSDPEFGDSRELLQPFQVPDSQKLQTLLIESRYNWFEIMDGIELGEDASKKCFAAARELVLSSKEEELLCQSYEAFTQDLLTGDLHKRKADALNQMIVSDSETDDPEQYIGLSLTCDHLSEVVSKKRKSIRRRARYKWAKLLAEQNYLGKRKSKLVKGIIQKFPNIGREIENFVKERDVGADAWRRTGVLTFDGNCQVKDKVTFKKIKQHLEEVYHRKFAYGTVVQLCVARNRRHRSAMRYKGVAQVTCRRARKGFCLRYNPDKHWSSALYRGLNYVQLTDGMGITLINRDDAAGFRLDTMATHRLQRTACVEGKQAVTTYTDYVNRYPSTLQVTSYNFTGTDTTGELCAGIVKALGVFPKNPYQHATDLCMLKNDPVFKHAFIDPRTAKLKLMHCIRVDGASDEGPSHEEIQFLWTAQHLESGTYGTLVSCRNSGASYLNRVELQNGCLALGHSNLFIPSTLGGSCLDTTSGKVDESKLRHNMNLAMDVYINRVDGSPCGETCIHLFKGSDSSEKQKMRPFLIQYLKGSIKQREALKMKKPALFAYFDKVWSLRTRHMTDGLPTHYLLYLLCSNCKSLNCPHPICQEERCRDTPKWFEGGPSVSYLPLPVPDISRPWGSNCSDCGGHCHGHYLKPVEAVTSNLKPMSEPPSHVIGAAFKKYGGNSVSESEIECLARQTLLSTEEVQLWLSHLETVSENRRRGAQKAAETRKLKNAQKSAQKQQPVPDVYYCGVCREQYVEYTNIVEKWIGCDSCDRWFHYTCIPLTSEPESYICEECKHS